MVAFSTILKKDEYATSRQSKQRNNMNKPYVLQQHEQNSVFYMSSLPTESAWRACLLNIARPVFRVPNAPSKCKTLPELCSPPVCLTWPDLCSPPTERTWRVRLALPCSVVLCLPNAPCGWASRCRLRASAQSKCH